MARELHWQIRTIRTVGPLATAGRGAATASAVRASPPSRVRRMATPVRWLSGQMPSDRRRFGRGLPPHLERRNPRAGDRSEEHTSELQSHVNLVCRLLLEKKKTP